MITLNLPVDATCTYVLLSPTQASVMACYCSMYGTDPPHGVYRATWKRVRSARAYGVSCQEFAAIGYHLLEALRAQEAE